LNLGARAATRLVALDTRGRREKFTVIAASFTRAVAA
jgi:hypothetical protein